MRMTKFSHTTMDDVLTLSVGNGPHTMEWKVDSAFAVHPDFKSHVGKTVSVEGCKGSPMNMPAEQKMNTESSTTAELVGVDHTLSLALCVPSFPKEQ